MFWLLILKNKVIEQSLDVIVRTSHDDWQLTSVVNVVELLKYSNVKFIKYYNAERSKYNIEYLSSLMQTIHAKFKKH